MDEYRSHVFIRLKGWRNFFKEEYIQLFGSSYERLASYISTQRNVLKILQDDKKYSFYQRINSYYGKMSASDIERICIQIEEMDTLRKIEEILYSIEADLKEETAK